MSDWNSDPDQTRRYRPVEGGYPPAAGGQYPPQGQYPQGQYPAQQYPAQQYPPQYREAPQQRPPAHNRPNPFGAESDQAFGIVGTVLALLGGIVLLVALTGLEWFRGGQNFGDVHTLLDNSPGAAGFASVYFSWFAWAALAVTVVAAVASCFPSPAVRALRIVGVVVGVAAAGLSFLAIQLYDNGSYVEFLKQLRVGFYLAVVGYLLAAIGAGIGPRKV